MEPPQRRLGQVGLPRQHAPGASPAPSDRRAVTLGILQQYKHCHLLLLQDGSVSVELLLLSLHPLHQLLQPGLALAELLPCALQDLHLCTLLLNLVFN